mgnify:CR=1 FL=1
MAGSRLVPQMVSMVYQLSSNADKEVFLRQEKKTACFMETVSAAWMKNIIFHYPGEVLERMEERRTMTKPVYRALGLALAGTSCIQEPCMFNGTQKNSFWKQFGKALGENDLCYLAVRYLLATKDRKFWADALYQYPYEKVEEMVFILSVFPESDALWQKLKGKIAACFGRKRSLSVYDDWHLYAWIVMKYGKRLKNDRTKETAVLKHLEKLSRTKCGECKWGVGGTAYKKWISKRRGDFSKWHPDRGAKIPGSELIDRGEDCSKGIENLFARRKDVSGCGV